MRNTEGRISPYIDDETIGRDSDVRLRASFNRHTDR